MKKNFTRASVLATMAALAVGSLQAKDLYLSPDGDDANDGLTAATPRKTLVNIGNVLEHGDIVHISGILHMQDEYDAAVAADKLTNNAEGSYAGKFYIEGASDQLPTGKMSGFNLQINDARWADLTFVGEDPYTDGFDGDSKWGFFLLRREGDSSKWVNPDEYIHMPSLNFKNLGFSHGKGAIKEGGAIWVQGGIIANFDNCSFNNNGFVKEGLKDATEGAMNVWDTNNDLTQERGGAFLLHNGDLTITNSTFSFNSARRGGCICQTGGHLILEDCSFENNGSYSFIEKPIKNTQGGALFIWTLHTTTTTDINRCSFVNNSAWQGGGAIAFLVNVDNKDRIIDANITNCYFGANNAVWEHGGAIFCNNQDGSATGNKNILAKFANCTFTGNMARFYAGNVYWRGGTKGSLLSFTNCTLSGGQWNGNGDPTNAGHGANITLEGNEAHPADIIDFEILNSILEGNKAGNDEYSDISFLGDYSKHIENLKVEHSVIGRVVGGGDYTFSGTNYINFYDGLDIRDGESASFDPDGLEHAAQLTYKGYTWGALPLAADSKAAEMGDKQYYVKAEKALVAGDADVNHTIRGFDISAQDAMGKNRGDNAVIGSTECTSDELWDIYDDFDGEITEKFEFSGIEGVVAENGALQLSVSGGVVSASENAIITVVALNGARVKQGKGSVDLNNLPAGVFVILAKDGKDTAAVKMVK